MKLFDYLLTLFSDKNGATAIEYAVMIALIIAVLIGIIVALGLNVRDLFILPVPFDNSP